MYQITYKINIHAIRINIITKLREVRFSNQVFVDVLLKFECRTQTSRGNNIGQQKKEKKKNELPLSTPYLNP